MTDIDILNKIKELLYERLKDVRLEKPNEDEEESYELINPAVYVGWIPPKNYLDEYGYDIPGIVVMEDNGEEDYGDTGLNIRLNLQTYDPGITYEGRLVPGTKGYTDILNLITKIRIILNESPSDIGIIVEKPIKWGFYDEQNYPYWAGYITFSVKLSPLPQINKFL